MPIWAAGVKPSLRKSAATSVRLDMRAIVIPSPKRGVGFFYHVYTMALLNFIDKEIYKWKFLQALRFWSQF